MSGDQQPVIMNNLSSIRKLIRQSLRFLHLPLGSCVLCGHTTETAFCKDCSDEFLPWVSLEGEVYDDSIDEVHAAYVFNYPLNHAIHALKYQGRIMLAKGFADELAPMMRKIHEQNSIDLVIGMPLHPRRLQQRGFNQSHEIATHLAKALGIPCKTEICSRQFHLQPQVELKLRERRHLPDKLFECAADLNGLHVLLVDDVMTTGTSLARLAKSVRLQGAGRVTACVVARVP
jgi:ComF family protein